MHGRTELLVKGKLEQHDWSERLSSGFGVVIKRMTNDVRLQILADFFFDFYLAVASVSNVDISKMEISGKHPCVKDKWLYRT